MAKDALVPDSIVKYLQSEDGNEFKPSFVVDGDKLAAISNDELFSFYRSCKAARAARIIIFYELQRRGKVGGKTVDGVPALNRFFADHGLNYETEYKFVYREKQAIEAEFLAASNPKPVPALAEPLTIGGTVFEKTNLEKPLIVKEANVTTGEVLVEDQSGDEPIQGTHPRADLITLDQKVAAETPKPPKPSCKKCVKLEAKITTLEAEKATLIATHKKKIDELKKSLDDLRAETKRKIADLKGKKQDDSAAKLDKPSGTKRVGDTSEPYLGFFWEFRKTEKPYGIRSVANPQLGVLCECKSETDAIIKIREYANEEAKAASA
jgi:hypothetical protein